MSWFHKTGGVTQKTYTPISLAPEEQKRAPVFDYAQKGALAITMQEIRNRVVAKHSQSASRAALLSAVSHCNTEAGFSYCLPSL